MVGTHYIDLSATMVDIRLRLEIDTIVVLKLVSSKGCYDGFIPPDTSDSTSSTLLTAAM